MSGSSISFLPPEKTCYICKKIFYARENMYAYKRGYDNQKKFFCSYGCMRAYDKQEAAKKLSKGKKRDEIITLRKSGKTRREVALMLGITEDTVEYYDIRYGGFDY